MKNSLAVFAVFAVFILCCSAAAQGGSAGVFCFYDGSAMHLRWHGVRSTDDPHYRVYREIDGSSEVAALKSDDLYRHSSAADIRRLSGTKASIYFSLFRGSGSDLTTADYSRLFADPHSLNFFNALCAVTPEFSKILGESVVDANVPKNTRVRYRIVALNGSDSTQVGISDFISTAAAQTVPTPTGIQGMAGDQLARISWNRNDAQQQSGEVASWNVYRASALSGPYLRLNAMPILAVSFGSPTSTQVYEDQFLFNGTSYYYAITSSNVAGIESSMSPSLEVVPQPALDVPQSLRARLVGKAVELDWVSTLASGVDNGFVVERRSGQSTTTHRVPAVSNDHHCTWFDTDISESQHLRYRVRCMRDNELGALSDSVEISIPDQTAPAAPLQCRASTSGSVVSLSWQRNSEQDLLGYEVERASDPRFEKQFLLTSKVISQNAYRDTLPAGAQYRVAYTIYAVDRAYNRSQGSEKVIVRLLDTSAPSVPVITSLESHDSLIDVHWTKSVDPDFKEFRVYRKAANSAVQRVLSTIADSAAVQLPNDGEYTVFVSSVDSSDNESQPSLPRSVQRIMNLKPAAPTQLKAEYRDGSILIQWHASTSRSVVGYGLGLRNADGSITDLKELKGAELEYLDPYTDPQHDQDYELRAFDAQGNLSDIASVHYTVPQK